MDNNSGSQTLTGTSFSYTLKIPFYLIEQNNDGSSYTNLVVSARAEKGSDTVTFPNYTLGTISVWQEKVATMDVTSSVNLCGDASDITVYFSVSGDFDPQRSRLYVQRQRFIELTCANANPGTGVQSCGVYYIP